MYANLPAVTALFPVLPRLWPLDFQAWYLFLWWHGSTPVRSLPSWARQNTQGHFPLDPCADTAGTHTQLLTCFSVWEKDLTRCHWFCSHSHPILPHYELGRPRNWDIIQRTRYLALFYLLVSHAVYPSNSWLANETKSYLLLPRCPRELTHKMAAFILHGLLLLRSLLARLRVTLQPTSWAATDDLVSV